MQNRKFNISSLTAPIAYGILIAWALLTLLPLFWLYVGAFTPQSQLISIPPEFSISDFSFVNLQRLFTHDPRTMPVARWMLNSLIISVTITAMSLFFDTLAGYAFARRKFPGSTLFFAMILSVMMIPPHALLVPRFILMTTWTSRFFGNLGIDFTFYGTWAGVIIPAATAPFGIFLIKQYVQSLPGELEDAARIDGCTEFQIFSRIIAPLAKPAIAVLGILVFVAQWNNYLWPMIMLNRSSQYTIQVGLATMQQQFSTDYGILLSGAALASFPIIFVFLVLQRFFVYGLTMGAVKG